MKSTVGQVRKLTLCIRVSSVKFRCYGQRKQIQVLSLKVRTMLITNLWERDRLSSRSLASSLSRLYYMTSDLLKASTVQLILVRRQQIRYRWERCELSSLRTRSKSFSDMSVQLPQSRESLKDQGLMMLMMFLCYMVNRHPLVLLVSVYKLFKGASQSSLIKQPTPCSYCPSIDSVLKRSSMQTSPSRQIISFVMGCPAVAITAPSYTSQILPASIIFQISSGGLEENFSVLLRDQRMMLWKTMSLIS